MRRKLYMPPRPLRSKRRRHVAKRERLRTAYMAAWWHRIPGLIEWLRDPNETK